MSRHSKPKTPGADTPGVLVEIKQGNKHEYLNKNVAQSQAAAPATAANQRLAILPEPAMGSGWRENGGNGIMADNRFKNGVYQNRHEQPVTMPVTVNPVDLGWRSVNGHWELNGHVLRCRCGWWIVYAAGHNGIGQAHASDEALIEATEELKPPPVEVAG